MGTVKYTGPVASFHCPTEATIRSLKVHFSPKQEGSGTPSPENVREIVGWDGVEINKSERNLIHLVGYSAVNLITTTATRKLTNGNGTTINTINPEKSVTITQTLWPATNKYSYQNGYFIVLDNNLKFEERYDVSFRVTNITNNPLNATLSDLMLYNPKGTSVGNTKIIDGDRVTFKNAIYNQNTATPLRHGFDIRICGMSCTISDFIVTAVDTKDRTYEPYRGETIDYEFGVLGKNKFPLTTSTTIENIKTGYNNKIARDITSTSIYQNVSANNYWVGSTTSSYVSSVGNGEITFSSSDGSYGAGMFVTVIPNQTYIISGNSEKVRFRVGYYNNDGTFSGQHFIANKAFTIPAEYHYAFIVVVPQTDYYNQEITVSNIQLELGTTATAYEPYNPNKTVYGGYVDVITGEVSEQWKSVDLDTLTWIYNEPNNAFYTSNIMYQILKNGANMYCNVYPTVNKYVDQINENAISSANSYGSGKIFIKNLDYTTVEDFVTSLDGAKLVFPLRQTAYNTYFLAPTQLQTFLGQNNVWSNANYVEVEYDLHETQTILARKQFIIANQPHIVKPAAAPLQNFVTDMAAPLKECKIHFSPVQEGKGDPSPENVRTISGWTGCEVYRTGKNLLHDKHELKKAQIDSDGSGGYQIKSANVYQVLSVEVPINTDLHIHKEKKYGSDLALGTELAQIGISVSRVGSMTNYFNRNFNTRNNPYAYLMISNNGAADDPELLWQLELGTTATAYEPYTGTTLSIDWTTEAGTVYGGYVDLTKKELVQTCYNMVVDENTTIYTSGDRHGVYRIVYTLPYLGANKNALMCNKFGLRDRNSAMYNYPIKGLIALGEYNANTTSLQIGAPGEITTREQWLNWLTENGSIQVIYELAEPIHYPLTIEMLKTLRGTNNIWASNGGDNIEIAYWKH